jgi:hypothetical protein
MSEVLRPSAATGTSNTYAREIEGAQAAAVALVDRFGAALRANQDFGRQPNGNRHDAFARKTHVQWALYRRREWDSNPRNRFRFCGFQDRCIKPLCHLSIRAQTSELKPLF